MVVPCVRESKCIKKRNGQTEVICEYVLAERGRHLVGERAGDDHAVGLSRRGAEDDAEAVEVVAGGAGVHHLHGAAGEAERHGPDRAPPRPVHQVVHLGHHELRSLRPRRRRGGRCSRRANGGGVGPRAGGEERETRRAGEEERHGELGMVAGDRRRTVVAGDRCGLWLPEGGGRGMAWYAGEGRRRLKHCAVGRGDTYTSLFSEIGLSIYS